MPHMDCSFLVRYLHFAFTMLFNLPSNIADPINKLTQKYKTNSSRKMLNASILRAIMNLVTSPDLLIRWRKTGRIIITTILQ